MDTKMAPAVPSASVTLPADAWPGVTGILTSICSGQRPIRVAGDVTRAMIDIRNSAGTVTCSGEFSSTRRIIERAFKTSLAQFGAPFFYGAVVPFIACLATHVPDVFPDGIPLLRRDGVRLVRLTKLQVAMLLSAAFWGSIPLLPSHKMKVNSFDFSGGFLQSAAKLQSLLAYFCAITQLFQPLLAGGASDELSRWKHMSKHISRHKVVGYLGDGDQKAWANGAAQWNAGGNGSPEDQPELGPLDECIDFALQLAPPSFLEPEDWFKAEVPLQPVRMFGTGFIEDGDGALQADFANAYIGGAVLTHGAVQEEIRFTVYPELLVALLFVPKMADDEAVVIVGAERFANHSGYASSFKFEGPVVPSHVEDSATHHRGFHGLTPVDRFGRRDIHLVAFDAINFSHGRKQLQYSPAYVHRELIKAWAAVQGDPFESYEQRRAFATGNWGAGVFQGDGQLKAVLQWFAASLAGREMHYYSFGNRALQMLPEVVRAIRMRCETVGSAYRHVLRVIREWRHSESAEIRHMDFFQALLSSIYN